MFAVWGWMCIVGAIEDFTIVCTCETTSPGVPVQQTHIEKELLQKVAAGNEDAFRQLVKAYADWLSGFTTQLTHDNALAEEIVQDIFVQIWLTRETLGNIRSFPDYLFIITRNHIYDALKMIRRREKRERDWQAEQLRSADPDAIEKEVHITLIDQAVAQLPPQQQRVWILSRRGGKKYREIAEEMGISQETVKKYLQYATAAIRTHVIEHLDIWWVMLMISYSQEIR